MLPMAMFLGIILAFVVTATATYSATTLRYSRVVEDRADRLAAADGGMRYAMEKLRLFQTLCTTKVAANGYTTVVPPSINGATISVTCDRVGTLLADIQGWAIVVTGAGVPSGSAIFKTQGGNGMTKSFGGPVFVADKDRLDMGAPAEIKDGDLWYSKSLCPTPAPDVTITNLSFSPDFLRGGLCTTQTWTTLFSAPTLPTVPGVPLAPVTTASGCKVFFPGKYTSAPVTAPENYMVSGNYYFEDVTWNITDTVVAGAADTAANGDGRFLTSNACAGIDKQPGFEGTGSGATFILGGSSRIYVGVKGGLEILRRRQGTVAVSVQAVDTTGGGYLASTVDYASGASIYESKSGNNSDVAIHGLWWTPNGKVVLGNVTNTANGQFLGGVVGAYVEVQASASVSALNIRVETSPYVGKVLLVSTATKNGKSNSIRAIVDFQPDTGFLAINSWRVV